MHIAAQVATVVAETEEHGNVALHTLPFGLVAIGIFGVLALIVSSYKNVANRHTDPAEHADEKH